MNQANRNTNNKRGRQDDEQAHNVEQFMIKTDESDVKCSEVEATLSFVLSFKSCAKPFAIWSHSEVREFLQGVPGKYAVRESLREGLERKEVKISGVQLSHLDEGGAWGRTFINYFEPDFVELPLLRMALRMSSTIANRNRFCIGMHGYLFYYSGKN